METLTQTLPPPSTNGHHQQTGPKTPAGKSQSRLNALNHGFRATDEIFISALKPREQKAFEHIRRALYRYYQPRSNPEKMLVDRMAIHHLRMLRVSQLESFALYFLPVNKAHLSLIPHLDRLSRYDVRIEKQLRILHNRYILMTKSRGSKILNSITDLE